MAELAGLWKRGVRKLRLFSRVNRLNRSVTAHASPDPDRKPVIFFNASTRLEGLNLNAAFGLISSWGVQLTGRRVIHFACQAGMKQCVLGAGVVGPLETPPCQGCVQHSRLYTGASQTAWFEYREDDELKNMLDSMSIAEMMDFSYQGVPLGKLVLPSLRWILRRHNLVEDNLTRYLFSSYILSGYSIAIQFSQLLEEEDPEAVVVFNGLQYPEAIVRWVSKEKDLRVITHEVNLQPFSAFFTDGQATIYPLIIPEDFQLSKEQNQKLDDYLAKRFKGDFRMAGIKFWSAMDQLPEDFLDYSSQFQAIVPVFTNVIFDTSQAHANTIFQDMFEWLDLVLETAKVHPETLFIIRAHPDEMRKGKSSQESVMGWAETRVAGDLPNIKLIGPDETLSSYELIQRSKFTMVYNSSIGLEATLLRSPVLCAGKARYTQYPTVFYPQSRNDYIQLLNSFLSDDEIIIPGEFFEHARKFLFYQLYKASLSFEDFLTEHPTPGYVQIKDLTWEEFIPGASDVVDCITGGIINGSQFLLENEAS